MHANHGTVGVAFPQPCEEVGPVGVSRSTLHHILNQAVTYAILAFDRTKFLRPEKAHATVVVIRNEAEAVLAVEDEAGFFPYLCIDVNSEFSELPDDAPWNVTDRHCEAIHVPSGKRATDQAQTCPKQ